MIMIRRPGDDDSTVHFAPGELVRHRRYGYRGVVVDLDPFCTAPEEWYRSNQTQPAREQPWYHVLVHGTLTVTYAAQSSLLPDTEGTEIEHPLVPEFFHGFEDGRYLRNDRPWTP